MAEAGARAAAPVDNAKMLAELKVKLSNMKRNMTALRNELLVRKDIWNAAAQDIEQLEDQAKEGLAKLDRARELAKKQKKEDRERRRQAKEKELNEKFATAGNKSDAEKNESIAEKKEDA